MAKILNRDEFLKLPADTVYAECDTGANIGALGIMNGVIGSDEFWLQELTETEGNMITDFENKDGSFKELKIDLNCVSRDGGFDQDQLFLVFDKQDVQDLIDRLQKCL